MTIRVLIKEQKTEAPFTLDDRIFIGEGIVETLKFTAYNPSHPKLHWKRLQKAAQFLEIPCKISFESWLESLKQCIKLTTLQDGGVRIVLSGGQAPRGLSACSPDPLMVITGFAYQPQYSAIRLASSLWRRDAANPIYQIKSINYLEAIIARRQAEASSIDDVLFFNFDDNVTETTIANIFLIRDNCLVTPPLNDGVLAGVARHRLLELSQKEGIKVWESSISRQQIMQAEAAFVCNSLQGIRAVQSLDEQIFDKNHPLISTLQTLLARDELDIAN